MIRILIIYLWLFIIDYVRLALRIERCFMISVTQEWRYDWIPWYFFGFGIYVNHLFIIELVLTYSLLQVTEMLLETLEFLALTSDKFRNMKE